MGEIVEVGYDGGYQIVYEHDDGTRSGFRCSREFADWVESQIRGLLPNGGKFEREDGRAWTWRKDD